MKIYLLSLGAGILVGIIYAFMHVRSPAPPAIALIGLLGILIGEQLVPIGARLLSGEPITVAWFKSECVPKIMGGPPSETESGTTTPGNTSEKS
jgi:XapX domain-containing protein